MSPDAPLKFVFLTFDDGPNEPYTSQILDLLARHNAKATFFVCGQNIERLPDSLQRIVAGGHALGIHSYSHNFWKTLSGNLLAEIELTRELIKRHGGVDTNLYRSPWGITLPRLSLELARRGYRLMTWDIMAFDWRQPPAAALAGHICNRAFPAAVILLHDGDQTGSGDRANTVKALPLILETLSQRGFQFLALNQHSLPRPKLAKGLALDYLAWIFQ